MTNKDVDQSASISDWVATCHAMATDKGFWDQERNVGEMLMLCVTELAEGMEAYRNDDQANFNEEIADTFIRLFDLCGGLGIDIEAAIRAKVRFNADRPYMHGKKC